jgi:C-terminal processing protease CtpA/Prc
MTNANDRNVRNERVVKNKMRPFWLYIFFGFSIFRLGGAAEAFAQTPSAAPASLADLETQATAAYTAKQYAESARLFAQAVSLSQGDQKAGDEYNEACSLALNGEKDRSLTVLIQAVDDGYSDSGHIAVDSDLVSLHGDTRWTQLLARMDAAKKAQDMRWGTAAFKSTYVDNLSDSDKVSGLSLLWAEARFGFANFWHVPELNWDETYKSYLPQVLATKSTAEYYEVLERFYALLQDGHTGVYEPEQLRTIPVPFQTRLVDGRVLVIGAYDAKFDMQGVKPGDEVVSINGQPVKEWAREKVAPYVTASSPQDRDERLYYRELMRGKAGTVFHLVLRTPAGKESSHDFAVGYHDPAPEFEFKMLPGDVAYVALNEFENNKDADEWDKHWPEIAKAKAVILDMRRNGGGDDGVGAHILATLIDKPVPGPRQESPEWIATYRAWGQAQPMMRYPEQSLPPDATHHFAGKVVMLTSANTFSAAEDAVVLFATSKRGVIVGEASGGSTGQPLSFNLPGGGTARVCSKHDCFPDGKEFVGVGVTPDVAAHLTREDLVRGTDSVLEAGLKVASQP